MRQRGSRRVHVIARTRDLGKSMSRYLVDRVEHLDNVEIHCGAVVTALDGDGPSIFSTQPGTVLMKSAQKRFRLSRRPMALRSA